MCRAFAAGSVCLNVFAVTGCDRLLLMNLTAHKMLIKKVNI